MWLPWAALLLFWWRTRLTLLQPRPTTSLALEPLLLLLLPLLPLLLPLLLLLPLPLLLRLLVDVWLPLVMPNSLLRSLALISLSSLVLGPMVVLLHLMWKPSRPPEVLLPHLLPLPHQLLLLPRATSLLLGLRHLAPRSLQPQRNLTSALSRGQATLDASPLTTWSLPLALKNQSLLLHLLLSLLLLLPLLLPRRLLQLSLSHLEL
mmetsp:Transcript_9952/g.15365  ORF Transcript_9952/g.15365 Transcript_9952/m.15365 type:complete len:206 (-) Transcript_9952:975-1592(-)